MSKDQSTFLFGCLLLSTALELLERRGGAGKLVDILVSLRDSSLDAKRTTTERRKKQPKPSAVLKDGHRSKHMTLDNPGPKRMPLVTNNIRKRKDLKRPFATKHASRSEAKMRMAFGTQAKTQAKTMAAACMTSWPEAAAFTFINNLKGLLRTLKIF